MEQVPEQLQLNEPVGSFPGQAELLVHSRHYLFALDYFGVLATPLLNTLMNKSGPKRARKVAFNSFVRVLKQTKQIDKDLNVHTVGLVVSPGGTLWISVLCKKETR